MLQFNCPHITEVILSGSDTVKPIALLRESSHFWLTSATCGGNKYEAASVF